MAVSDIEAVIEFLRKNGFSESESALREDVKEKSQLGSTDFERFLFPMVPPPPRLKIPATSSRLPQASSGGDAVDHASSLSSSEEEFVSLDSSTTEFCSSGDFLPSKFPFFPRDISLYNAFIIFLIWSWQSLLLRVVAGVISSLPPSLS